jgi:hypothetical protein
VHREAFTLYPVGHAPYGREVVLDQVPGGADDPRASLVGAAVAACRGDLWPEGLDEGGPGPVRRTQRRRIAGVARLVGLDGPEVSSQVAGELGLGALALRGSLSERVAALSQLGPGLGAWLRVAGAVDVAGRQGVVGVLAGVARTRLNRASGRWVRPYRGPPAQGVSEHESVLGRRSESQ